MIAPDHLAAARVLWDYTLIDDVLEPADAIVGLGSYDLRVAERCAALFAGGLAPEVIFTGHSGAFTRGRFTDTEARTFAAHAVSAGLPEEAIRLEERATNTSENVRFVAEMLPGAPRVILVSKPQMQLRCKAAQQVYWPGANARFTAPKHDMEEQATPDFPLYAVIEELVGTVARIADYPARGFQAAQPMPAQVCAARAFLEAAGYTRLLPVP